MNQFSPSRIELIGGMDGWRLAIKCGDRTDPIAEFPTAEAAMAAKRVADRLTRSIMENAE